MSDLDTKDRLQTVKADATDAVDEAKNRAQALGERAKRTVAGDELSPGETIVSHLKEAGHELTADLDKASRRLRHEDGGEG
ncbi:MAG: hypothetical protein WCE44_14315 [Candidatus Velthaea sp.]|jgi:adenylate kinase family enzyme